MEQRAFVVLSDKTGHIRILRVFASEDSARAFAEQAEDRWVEEHSLQSLRFWS